MKASSLVENQRRTAFFVIDELATRLTPGRPFMVDLRNLLAARRGFGARDRRIYRDLVFTWLRHRAWFDAVRERDQRRAMDVLVALAPDSPELASLQLALGLPGGLSRKPWPELRAGLEALAPGSSFLLRDLLPSWFESHCPALFEDAEVLCQIRRPPLWLRAQRGTAAETVHALATAGVAATIADSIPGAVRVTGHVDLEAHPVVAEGRAEIQDIGSQALLAMAGPAPGTTWLDLCAGGGGKTLQLAGMIGPAGRVTAHDIRRDALMETRRRMHRAGLKNIHPEPVLPEPGMARFDGVLVDAPCSASGTWRRHPFLRHQLTAAVINRHAREQLDLLARATNYLRPGGRLLYATCSLSRRENDDIVARFLTAFREFTVEPPAWNPGLPAAPSGTVTIQPSALDGDGYFLACLRHAG